MLWCDGTVNHIVSECSKLAQKEYNSRHEWMEKGSAGNCAKV